MPVIKQETGSFPKLNYVMTVDFVKLKIASSYPQYSSNTQTVRSYMKVLQTRLIQNKGFTNIRLTQNSVYNCNVPTQTCATSVKKLSDLLIYTDLY
jgi:hypothetical protein